MNSFVNCKYLYWEVRTNFLIYLNFYFKKQKCMKINLTIYKFIIEESLLILLLKAFIRDKGLRLDILHYIYIKKMI